MAVLVIEPPELFVTLATAKEHLRVDHGDEDALIGGYLAQAIAEIDGPEGWAQRAIGVQTLEYVADDFERCEAWISLPCGPVISIEQISYLDPSGETQELGGDAYKLLTRGRVRPSAGSTWPSVQPFSDVVRIRYRAGYQDAVPPPARSFALIRLSDYYEHRGSPPALGENKAAVSQLELLRSYSI